MVLKFTSLPFTPERGQVIYVESEYNEKLNKFIRNNYASLKSDFATKVLQFCYLPLLAEGAIRYNAPYVGKERLKYMASQVPSLAKYAIGMDNIEPSLAFAIDLPVTDESGIIILYAYPSGLNGTCPLPAPSRTSSMKSCPLRSPNTTITSMWTG